jgi:hypothetical protein
MKNEGGGGGLGGWQIFEDSFGPWRSFSVCFLMLSSSFLQEISVSKLIGDWHPQSTWNNNFFLLTDASKESLR